MNWIFCFMVGGGVVSTVLCRSCKVIIRWFSIETQCDLSAVMKVSGNLSHMSSGHLHTLSVALSWRLHRAYGGQRTHVSLSVSSRWHFKALSLKAELTQKRTPQLPLSVLSKISSGICNLREIDDNTCITLLLMTIDITRRQLIYKRKVGVISYPRNVLNTQKCALGLRAYPKSAILSFTIHTFFIQPDTGHSFIAVVTSFCRLLFFMMKY